MILSPTLMIAIGSLFLMGLAGIALVADKRVRAHKARLDGVLSAYAPAVAQSATAGMTTNERLLRLGWISGLLGLFRIEPNRPDLYPAPWYVVAMIVTMVAVIIAGGASLMIGSLAWLALPVVWFVLMRWAFSMFLAKRSTILYNQLPDALAMIVRSVRAGLPVQEALRVVGEEGQSPTTLEFSRLYDDLRVGGSLPDALAKLAARTALLEYKFFAVSLSLQNQSGGSLTETLENLADVIRKRVALKQRAIALASEAKMTMYVLAGLPFVAAGALLVLSPAYVSLLVTTPTGLFILFIGITLLSLGLISMRVIIKKSTS